MFAAITAQRAKVSQCSGTVQYVAGFLRGDASWRAATQPTRATTPVPSDALELPSAQQRRLQLEWRQPNELERRSLQPTTVRPESMRAALGWAWGYEIVTIGRAHECVLVMLISRFSLSCLCTFSKSLHRDMFYQAEASGGRHCSPQRSN